MMLRNKNILVNSFLYACLFIGAPLMVIFYYLLGWSHDIYLFLGQDFGLHYTILCLGVLAGIILFYTRLRWTIIVLLLLIILQVILSFIEKFVSVDDIDLFFVLNGIRIKIALFFLASLLSYSLISSRLSSLFAAIVLTITMVFLIVQSTMLNQVSEGYHVEIILIVSSLLILYFLFIQYKHRELVQSSKEPKSNVLVQSMGFLAMLLLIAFLFVRVMDDQIADMKKQLSKEFEPELSESLEERTSEGVRVKKQSKLTSRNNRTNELLMVAYIDNFFDDLETPNPLYLTSFYFTYFDSTTETFKSVQDMPDKDLLSPDPSSIPLYFTEVDSSVLDMIKDHKMLKTVDIEVYNKGLDPTMFFAPSTSFMIQPIAVDENFQQEYKSAYKSKSLVSELNSAYFIYNSEVPEVREFQERRIELLRSVKDFSEVRADVYDYYTQLPQVDYLLDIKKLTLDITANATTPIDKIVAIKDYFQSKDASGTPLFKYSDNPGIPDLPSASKLHYFLFQNRSGYCAYYAGATLIMLRSLGIPSRINVGFLTQDRSTVNKGWYYFYANQLHAWVQVYFPGYGWIDFDTTVGNTEAQESPQPDGTPPTAPEKAAVSIFGTVMDVDTSSKIMRVMSNMIVLFDSTYKLDEPIEIAVDMNMAKVTAQNKPIQHTAINLFDTASVISFNKKLSTDFTLDNITQQRIPADKIIIKPFQKHLPQDSNLLIEGQNNKWVFWLMLGLSVLTLFVVLCALPNFLLKKYLKKSQNAQMKVAYQGGLQALQFYLYQNKIADILSTTPSHVFEKIDKDYTVQTTAFYKNYQSVKFSSNSPVNNMWPVKEIIDTIDKLHYKDISFIKKLVNKINFVRTIQYLANNK